MVLALTLWVCSALPVSEVARPGGAIAKPVVQVLLSEAEVNIDPGSGRAVFKAARGMLLQEADTVQVGPGAWVALAILGNQQVVRLDDDLSMKIGELALLNAPPQATSVVHQLDLVLTSKERERTERLIGWHASPTAANTPQMNQPPHGSGPAPKPPPPGAAMGGPSANAKSDDEERTAAAPKEAAVTGEVYRPDPAPAATEKPFRRAAAKQKNSPRPRSQLQQCIEGEAASWGPEVKAKLGKRVNVEARLKDGEVLARLPLGVPAPACAVEFFEDRGGLSTNWTNVTVTLQ